MNRADFMKNLAELLADVPLSEREEAIHYYNDYFDDAGEENEQSVIASLGTPEQLARTIKAGLADGENIGEFTEKGFSEYENRNNGEVPDLYRGEEKSGEEEKKNVADSYYGHNQSGSQSQNQNQYEGQNSYNNQNQYNGQGGYNNQNQYSNQNSTDVKPRKTQMSTGTIILIVILCILASPFILGIGGGLLGVIVGIFGAVFGIVVAFGAVAVSLIAVGIVLFVNGIAMLFGTPVAGFCLIGAALILAAIGLVFLWLTVLICGSLIPLVFKGIGKLFSAIFGKGGAKA